MDRVPDTLVERYIRACRQAADMRLVLFNSGNLSLRVDTERMIIKTMGSSMGSLGAGEVSLCSIEDGRALDGKVPSKELGFHAGVLAAREGANSVFHFQSTYATAVSCMKETVKDFNLIPEIAHYIGGVAYVEYYTPGSPELARAVVDAARSRDMVILRNHGLVAVGSGLDDVILKAGYFEMTCEILLHVKNPSKISRKDAEFLRKR